jgi:hypothetical protein
LKHNHIDKDVVFWESSARAPAGKWFVSLDLDPLYRQKGKILTSFLQFSFRFPFAEVERLGNHLRFYGEEIRKKEADTTMNLKGMFCQYQQKILIG